MTHTLSNDTPNPLTVATPHNRGPNTTHHHETPTRHDVAYLLARHDLDFRIARSIRTLQQAEALNNYRNTVISLLRAGF